MKLGRFALKSLAAAALGAVAFGSAHAAEFTLRYAHFWPSNSKVHTELFEAWAKSVEKASNGRIAVQLFPAQTLAKAEGSYQAMVNGVADIVSTVQGYTTGRFPLTQIAEFPGIGNSASQTGCVLQSLYDQGLLNSEYSDAHVLYMFSTGPGMIHTRNKLVKTPEDLKGMRIRNPAVIPGQILQKAGARTASMPAPEAYESMQRGVIDGVVFPWEAVQVFRLIELTRYHTEIPLYSTAFVTAMNKRTYDRLPPDLKKVIDDHSGPEWQRRAGAVFDSLDISGRERAVADKQEIYTIKDPLATPDWGPILKGVIDEYLETLKKQNLPGEKVYEAAQKAKESCPVSPSAS